MKIKKLDNKRYFFRYGSWDANNPYNPGIRNHEIEVFRYTDPEYCGYDLIFRISGLSDLFDYNGEKKRTCFGFEIDKINPKHLGETLPLLKKLHNEMEKPYSRSFRPILRWLHGFAFRAYWHKQNDLRLFLVPYVAKRKAQAYIAAKKANLI